MDFKQYEAAKFALAEILRSAMAIDTKDPHLESESRSLLTRLAEDRFNLMLVGRFSRGKSTLINALLGKDHLPTGVVPLTSVITTVKYGSRAQVVVNFNESRFRQEIPLSRLADYVTQQSNPGNVKNVEYAEIELPVELLRRGLFFVDSPGLGSSIAENTRTTEKFIPHADAFVLVTSYDSPLSAEEDRILRQVHIAGKRLFVVVNKQDTVNPNERSQALSFVTRQLEHYHFSVQPKVFSISARQGLEGKTSKNTTLTAQSGILEFERELFRFLTEDRMAAFLQNMHERIAEFLVRRSQLDRQTERRTTYETLFGRLTTLRSNDPRSVPSAARTAEIHGLAVPLSLDFNKRIGCGICAEVFDAIFDFLSKYQYELTVNPDVQQEHARRKGFCTLHTWQFENIANPYSVCASFPQLAYSLARGLQESANRAESDGSSIWRVHDLVASQETCVCALRAKTEQQAVNSVVAKAKLLDSSKNAAAPACCLTHLAMTVKALGIGQPAKHLLHAHARFLERLGEDAQRYVLRQDGLRRDLMSAEEQRASRLLLLMIAGDRSVSAPWQDEIVI